jgi:hypothetical protein
VRGAFEKAEVRATVQFGVARGGGHQERIVIERAFDVKGDGRLVLLFGRN